MFSSVAGVTTFWADGYVTQPVQTAFPSTRLIERRHIFRRGRDDWISGWDTVPGGDSVYGERGIDRCSGEVIRSCEPNPSRTNKRLFSLYGHNRLTLGKTQ